MKKTLVVTLGLLGGLALAGQAHAQALRPNILIIFDTSGSMLYSQRLDGSPICNIASTNPNRTAAQNTTDGQTSRIYRLKSALRDATKSLSRAETVCCSSAFTAIICREASCARSWASFKRRAAFVRERNCVMLGGLLRKSSAPARRRRDN